MTFRERFLAACRHEAVDRPPVWLMRQAGRYMAEYRAVRAHHSLLDICHSPRLAAEVTITAAERLGTDAAILFADLLLPCEPLGIELQFLPGEGPHLEPAIRTPQQIAQLPARWGGRLDYVAEAMELVARHFRGDRAVLGFAGAPFTLASYLVEGGSNRSFAATKRLMWEHPGPWNDLLAKLGEGLGEFLADQVRAGADAIQIFDSWAGALSADDYRRHVLPHTQRLVARVRQTSVPVIYFSTATAGYLEAVAETGADVISLDWRIELGEAWRRLEAFGTARGGLGLPALQGNLDPLTLVGREEIALAETERVLSQGRVHPGYIFNLGHGIVPETPVENVAALVRAVQRAG